MSEPNSIPVFDLQNLIDPYPMYKQLRDEAPVYHVPELNMYYVTSYELLRQVIRDTSTYSSQYDDFMAFSRDAGMANLPDEIKGAVGEKMREMIPTPPTHLRTQTLVGFIRWKAHETRSRQDQTRVGKIGQDRVRSGKIRQGEDQVARSVLKICSRVIVLKCIGHL